MRNTTKASLEQVHTSIINRVAGTLDLTILHEAMQAGVPLRNRIAGPTLEFLQFYKERKTEILQQKLDELRSEVGLCLIPLSKIYKESK